MIFGFAGLKLQREIMPVLPPQPTHKRIKVNGRPPSPVKGGTERFEQKETLENLGVLSFRDGGAHVMKSRLS